MTQAFLREIDSAKGVKYHINIAKHVGYNTLEGMGKANDCL